ncbi:nuclear transport factor 2 family protein [Mycobacterium sp.]|uniref:nuclear transport factor 2 family protein n=1 Tax=Mycobacterium sp. TaxID=1785 RepID=UPI0031DCA3F5
MTLSTSDRAALADVVHRYAAGVDDRHFDSVTALFVDDAELIVPDPPGVLEPVRPHRGRAAIAAAVAAVTSTLRTEHAIVGEVYDDGPRPDRARGRIVCIAHHWIEREGEIRDLVWHLRYDDEYQRVGSDWRIRRRALTIVAIEDRPVRRLQAGL